MILRTSVSRLIPVVLLAVAAAGCGDDNPTMPSQTLFEKYGGAPTVGSVRRVDCEHSCCQKLASKTTSPVTPSW